MSRDAKAYASAYQTRDHESLRRVGDVTPYACDFNGALRDGETISTATWESDHACVSLSGLDVTDGVAETTLTANLWGCAWLTLTATTSAGRTLQQRYVVRVQPQCGTSTSPVSWP
jgi:hypothetical protein